MNICVIGTGRRFKNIFFDVFTYYLENGKINLCAVCNKSGILDKKIMEKLKLNKIYTDYDDMINNYNIDIIIILLPDKLLSETISDLQIKYKNIRIITETGFSLYKLKNISKSDKIGVFENWAYLPLEQVKRKILDKNIIGNILQVENDQKSFYYHASSQLRNYIGNNNETYKIFLKNKDIVLSKLGNIKFINKKSVNVCSKELIIIGENGFLKGDCFCISGKRFDPNDFKFDLVYNNQKSKIVINKNNNFLKSIEVTLNNSEKIIWENKYGNFNEEQLSIFYHMEHLLSNNSFLYTLNNFIIDLELMPSK